MTQLSRQRSSRARRCHGCDLASGRTQPCSHFVSGARLPLTIRFTHVSTAKLQSLLQSALVHHRAGRLGEAENYYRQVRATAPNNFDALHLSGLLAYQQDRMTDAANLLTRAHRLNPKAAECEMRLALAMLHLGRLKDAEMHLRHVVQQNPKFTEGWDNLAYLLKTQDRLSEAITCHEKAVAGKPEIPMSWYNYGLTLSLFGRYDDALRCHDRALVVDRKCEIAHFGRAQALHQADRIEEAVAAYRTFLALKPANHEARSYLLFAMHCLPNVTAQELFSAHVEFGTAVGLPRDGRFSNSPDPARRLRVAILSPDLRMHSCAYFLEPLLRHLDRRDFELYLYHDHFREDAISDRLRKFAATWRNFRGQPPGIVESTIRSDAPDILIDLAGHTGMTNRLPLFAKRLAPVQVSYLGYPNTTGVAAMDYRFTDALADPLGEADQFATEKLIRFAPTAWAYSPPDDAPLPALVKATGTTAVTFGCFNSPTKISDEVLVLWGRILSAVQGSTLLLKGTGFAEPAVLARYHARLAKLGLPLDRIELLDRTPDTKSHLAVYNRVDVALDTFPYHGTTTTCEALWMGVPVVTFAGDRHMSRVGVSLLTAAGHPEWIARSAEAYVEIAAALAAAHDSRAALRTSLRDELLACPLLDHAAQSKRFTSALRECWGAWCVDRGGSGERPVSDN
jgi:protein O-GlcNAc transferase